MGHLRGTRADNVLAEIEIEDEVKQPLEPADIHFKGSDHASDRNQHHSPSPIELTGGSVGVKIKAIGSGRNQAIGYVRVFTEEQARHGISLASQAERIRAYCVMSGLDLEHIVSDEGVSASKRLQDRPGGAQITDRSCRHIVAVKLDRLFRDAQDALEQTRAWDRRGTALHLIDMGGATVNTASAIGRFFLTMIGFAELERNLIAERTSTALQHKKRMLQVYGPTPYGYTNDGPKLAESRNEQAIVTLIRQYRSDGWTPRAIAEALNTMDVTRKRGGKRWYASTVESILRNSIHGKAA